MTAVEEFHRFGNMEEIMSSPIEEIKEFSTKRQMSFPKEELEDFFASRYDISVGGVLGPGKLGIKSKSTTITMLVFCVKIPFLETG